MTRRLRAIPFEILRGGGVKWKILLFSWTPLHIFYFFVDPPPHILTFFRAPPTFFFHSNPLRISNEIALTNLLDTCHTKSSDTIQHHLTCVLRLFTTLYDTSQITALCEDSHYSLRPYSLFTNDMQRFSWNIFATGCRSHMGVSPLVLELKL